jgi:hypothetical protein
MKAYTGHLGAASDLADAGRVAERGGRHVERLQQLFETGFVVDVIQQLDQRHEAHAIQLVGDEG